ncbi:MAG: hypothetical protein AAF627_21485 [Myxococcota bacterium]
MTRRVRKWPPAGWILALLLIFFSCSASTPGRRSGLKQAQVEAMPTEVQDAYRLFAQRCSRCHTLARPLNSGITDGHHWRVYVRRMRKMPGSGISYRDADRILLFLDYYSLQVEEGRWSGGLRRDLLKSLGPDDALPEKLEPEP